jgi:hypothetical protein
MVRQVSLSVRSGWFAVLLGCSGPRCACWKSGHLLPEPTTPDTAPVAELPLAARVAGDYAQATFGGASWKEPRNAIAASFERLPQASRTASISATASPASAALALSSIRGRAGRGAKYASRASTRYTPARAKAGLRSVFTFARIAGRACSGRAIAARPPAGSQSAPSRIRIFLLRRSPDMRNRCIAGWGCRPGSSTSKRREPRRETGRAAFPDQDSGRCLPPNVDLRTSAAGPWARSWRLTQRQPQPREIQLPVLGIAEG